MKIHNSFDTFIAKNPIVTIGMFDGVHTGHTSIIQQLHLAKKEYNGEAVVVTFWPHPRMVFGNSSNFILTTIDEKCALLKTYGVDHCIIIPFSEQFSRISAKDYITHILYEKIKVAKIIIGHDHRYGYKGEGDFALLKKYGESLGFAVEEIPAFEIETTTVSSSKIRNAIIHGNLETANTLLGYTYSFAGTVIHGKKIGRTIGVPTANILAESKEKIIPGNGVYIGAIRIKNKYYNAVISVGVNPTIHTHNTNIHLEAHILDFSENIYDETVRLYFIHKIRNERAFKNLTELKNAIQNDITYARNYYKSNFLKLTQLY
ncbi:MAG: bifunctional riboflavin kinase/FAD synthetase [Bacteroidales bacterium]|nr:bifunctional riboflavin kinase/FAD synthetase [Bacteroidales bacterium]NLK81693.1 bifunctional riboflavin kinase/FAD synthetase [Bacteroidales bacterium]